MQFCCVARAHVEWCVCRTNDVSRVSTIKRHKTMRGKNNFFSHFYFLHFFDSFLLHFVHFSICFIFRSLVGSTDISNASKLCLCSCLMHAIVRLRFMTRVSKASSSNIDSYTFFYASPFAQIFCWFLRWSKSFRWTNDEHNSIRVYARAHTPFIGSNRFTFIAFCVNRKWCLLHFYLFFFPILSKAQSFVWTHVYYHFYLIAECEIQQCYYWFSCEM